MAAMLRESHVEPNSFNLCLVPAKRHLGMNTALQRSLGSLEWDGVLTLSLLPPALDAHPPAVQDENERGKRCRDGPK